MTKKPTSTEVVEEAGVRVCITTYSDGVVVRTPVDPKKKPTRKPRLRRQIVRIKDHTRKKQF